MVRVFIISLFIIFGIQDVHSNGTKNEWQIKELDVKNVDNISVLSKTYGYIRYFYPNDKLKKFDWYRFLILSLNEIERIESNEDLIERLYELFVPICPQIQFSTSVQIPSNSSSPTQSRPFYVQEHAGENLCESGNIRLIEKYDERLPVPDSMYCFRLQDNLYLYFPIAVTKLPENTKDLRFLKKKTRKIRLKLYDQSILKILFDKNSSKEVAFLKHYNARIADIIIRRNIIQHFYPYFYEDGLDLKWNQICERYYDNAAKSSNIYHFFDLVRMLMHNVKDSHIQIPPSVHLGGILGGYLQLYYPDFPINIISKGTGLESEYNLSAKGAPASFFTKVNGIDINEVIESKLDKISYSTKKHGLSQLSITGQLLSSFKKDSIITLTMMDKYFEQDIEIITNKDSYTNYNLNDSVFIVPVNDSITYVNVCSSSGSYLEFEKQLDLLSASKITILDLRGYPMDYTLSVLSHYLDTVISLGNLQKMNVYYPDHQNIILTEIPKWCIAPATSKESLEYSKKYDYIYPKNIKLNSSLYVFACESSMSYSETLLEMIKHYNIGTIVGDYTAGCNGDAVYVDMYFAPFTMTGHVFSYRDGSQHHSIGIKPDIFISTGESFNVGDQLLNLLKDVYYEKNMGTYR